MVACSVSLAVTCRNLLVSTSTPGILSKWKKRLNLVWNLLDKNILLAFSQKKYCVLVKQFVSIYKFE